MKKENGVKPKHGQRQQADSNSGQETTKIACFDAQSTLQDSQVKELSVELCFSGVSSHLLLSKAFHQVLQQLPDDQFVTMWGRKR
jgi:hypothetical protein